METKSNTTKVVQITSGNGPAECGWVVAQVLKTFLEKVTQKGFQYQILHREKGIENGTIQSVVLKITGKHLGQFLSPWLGTIQWIGVSSFRPKHKRKNWFIRINEIKHIEYATIEDKDIRYQATRSSGPGGQHVNKGSSAIRATHVPTKTQVLVMDSRSQHQNKKIAKQRLLEKVTLVHQGVLKEGAQTLWKNHHTIPRGNPVKVFKGSDFALQKKDKTYKKRRNALKKELRKHI